MKKILTILLSFALIFNFASATVFAAAQKTQSILPYTSSKDPDGSGGDDNETAPPEEPSTPPQEPEEPSNSPQEPDPAPPEEPSNPPQKPDPVPPENTTPPSTDNGGSSNNNNNYYDDDSSYDDSDSYTPSYRDNSYEEPVPTASSTVDTTVEEQVQEVQQVEGDYPVTLTIKQSTIDVNMTDKAYTVTQNQNTLTVDFNNDALNTALTAGSTKLAEKVQAGATTLNKLVLKIPAVDTTKLTDPTISLRVPAPALKNMQTAKATLNMPINKDSLIIAPSLLTSDALGKLGDADKLVIGIKKGPDLKNTSYKLSDSQLTPVNKVMTLEAGVLNSAGGLSALTSFNKGMEINTALTDAEASTRKDGDQFTVIKYSKDKDTLETIVTTYHADTKVATYTVTAPGDYLVMLNTQKKGINPLFIVIPIIILVAVGGGIFAYMKIKGRKNRNIFGDYDD